MFSAPQPTEREGKFTVHGYTLYAHRDTETGVWCASINSYRGRGYGTTRAEAITAALNAMVSSGD